MGMKKIKPVTTVATAEATEVACSQCGADLPAKAARHVVSVKARRGGLVAHDETMCKTCAFNYAAKQTLGGTYVEGSMRVGPNRAVRRHPQVAPPPAKPVHKRRATRGERRMAKKNAVRQAAKAVAA